jgi:hypothetical protein
LGTLNLEQRVYNYKQHEGYIKNNLDPDRPLFTQSDCEAECSRDVSCVGYAYLGDPGKNKHAGKCCVYAPEAHLDPIVDNVHWKSFASVEEENADYLISYIKSSDPYAAETKITGSSGGLKVDFTCYRKGGWYFFSCPFAPPTSPQAHSVITNDDATPPLLSYSGRGRC